MEQEVIRAKMKEALDKMERLSGVPLASDDRAGILSLWHLARLGPPPFPVSTKRPGTLTARAMAYAGMLLYGIRPCNEFKLYEERQEDAEQLLSAVRVIYNVVRGYIPSSEALQFPLVPDTSDALTGRMELREASATLWIARGDDKYCVARATWTGDAYPLCGAFGLRWVDIFD